MTTILKMNRNRQLNLPSALVSRLNLGESRYFKAELDGNRVVLTPVDPVERVFSNEDLDLMEKLYQKEKHTATPVTKDWIKKIHRHR